MKYLKIDCFNNSGTKRNSSGKYEAIDEDTKKEKNIKLEIETN